jgi:ATP-dependent RNA helicase DeaD
VGTEISPATAPPNEARFEELGLSDAMLAAIAAAEYLRPTPIQAGLIPRALAGVDVLGQARTGTGKTAAFVIPILERIEPHKRGTGPQALVLVPTRELAVQVREEVVKLAHGRKIHSVAVYGGKPIRGQIEKLQRGAEVVIGTPGRVLDHLSRGTLVLNDLKIVVLDEADRMLDIGFRPDIEKILRRCPRSRQTLLLSATVPPPVEKLARSYMRDPETQNFSPKDISVDTIEQFYVTIDQDRKFEALERMVTEHQPQQAIVFCRTKRGTDKVFRKLNRKHKDAECIHGDLAQGARDRVMSAFRAGNVRILVATDVVGRGIDVSSISHIYNYDIPQFCDDYVHRVGRTGRMGREGVAYTLVTPEEGNELTRIEIRINKMLTKYEIPNFHGVSVSEPTRDLVTAAATAPPNPYITQVSAPRPGQVQQSPKRGKYRRAL